MNIKSLIESCNIFQTFGITSTGWLKEKIYLGSHGSYVLITTDSSRKKKKIFSKICDVPPGIMTWPLKTFFNRQKSRQPPPTFWKQVYNPYQVDRRVCPRDLLWGPQTLHLLSPDLCLGKLNDERVCFLLSGITREIQLATRNSKELNIFIIVLKDNLFKICYNHNQSLNNITISSVFANKYNLLKERSSEFDQVILTSLP